MKWARTSRRSVEAVGIEEIKSAKDTPRALCWEPAPLDYKGLVSFPVEGEAGNAFGQPQSGGYTYELMLRYCQNPV